MPTPPWLAETVTRDGARSRFAGKPKYPADNADHRHGDPGRRDYAVFMTVPVTVGVPVLTVFKADGVTPVDDPEDLGLITYPDGFADVVLTLKNTGNTKTILIYIFSSKKK